MSVDRADEYEHSHYLPQDDWDAVVVEAERIHAERVAEEGLGGGAEYLPLGLTPRRIKFPDTYGKTSGPIVRYQLYVNHTAECPLRAGYAESLTKWGNGGYEPRASWPRFVDPATVAEWVSLNRAAFLHGPANSLGWGWEQAGYARFTRAEWLTPDGLRQLDLLAQEIVRCGIPVEALRWLTDAQVQAIVERRDTTTRGLCDHRQISPKTRSDSGNGYPRDVLLDFIKAYHPGVPNRTPPGTPGTVRIGDRGEQVATVQRLLAAAGYDPGTIDGVAGPLFDAAVKAFQKANGLDVDGVVGPKTLAALQPKPAPTEPPQEDDMALTDDDIRRIADAILWAPAHPGIDPRTADRLALSGSSVRNNIGAQSRLLVAVAEKLGVDVDATLAPPAPKE